MECAAIEKRLSEYLEHSLPPDEMAQVAGHLQECRNCVALFEEMRSILVSCSSFPSLEPDVALVERILLRTSGKPRTRTFSELFRQYFLQPMLTPRFAVGAGLAALFLALLLNFMMPRVSVVATALSPRELLRHLDRGSQQLYSEGLKIYDKKNEWQAQFSFFKNNMLNKLGFMIERLDVPVEGKQKKSGEPRQQQEKTPSEKSSVLLLRA